MIGQATITVKDKNGNIKNKVSTHNVVFDIPKHITMNALNADIQEVNFSYVYNLPVYMSGDLRLLFESIRVNDEYCSETNCKDFKMPILTGGRYDKYWGDNKYYSKCEDSNYDIEGNHLKFSYTWNYCPAFDIKSINLCDRRMSLQFYGGNNGIFDYSNITKGNKLYRYGNFFWLNGGFSTSTINNNDLPNINKVIDNVTVNVRTVSGYLESNAIYKANTGTFDFKSGRRVPTQLLRTGAVETSASDYNMRNGYKAFNIYPLYNNEIVIFRENDDLTTNETSYSNRKYLVIADVTGSSLIKKRSFPITQFEGMTYSSVSSWYFAVIPMEDADYLYAYISNNTTALYRIPREATNDTIPKIVAYDNLTDFTTGITIKNFTNMYFINNTIIDFERNKAFSIIKNDNDSTTETLKYYDHTGFNRYQNIDNYGVNTYPNYQAYQYSCPSRLCTMHKFNIPNFYEVPIWGQSVYNNSNYLNSSGRDCYFNTTVLNLAQPVAVEEGDSVNIEYNITAI